MKTLFLIFSFLITGCQLPYYIKSGYHQALLIKNQKPAKEVLKDQSLSSNERKKIQLILDTKEFAETQLNLKPTHNYTNYVSLNRPYVTYIVQVAYPFDLKYKLWDFPIVGSLPYKGFFKKEDAVEEAKLFKKDDVFIRGVRAYSTLGWMKDPILSSMTSYDDEDLVNLIIHELTHSTVFIKNSADFNEQLATFIGNKGTEIFFKENLEILKKIELENKDSILFASFIQKESKNLNKFYSEIVNFSEEEKVIKKKQFFESMKTRFKEIKWNTKQYEFFSKMELNNASFLGFKTYYYDLSEFEIAYKKCNESMKDFIREIKRNEKIKNPEENLIKNLNCSSTAGKVAALDTN